MKESTQKLGQIHNISEPLLVAANLFNYSNKTTILIKTFTMALPLIPLFPTLQHKQILKLSNAKRVLRRSQNCIYSIVILSKSMINHTNVLSMKNARQLSALRRTSIVISMTYMKVLRGFIAHTKDANTLRDKAMALRGRTIGNGMSGHSTLVTCYCIGKSSSNASVDENRIIHVL